MSNVAQPLHRRNVLIITDGFREEGHEGSVPLSKALLDRLTETRLCRVITIVNSTERLEAKNVSSGVFVCDLSNRRQVIDLFGCPDGAIARTLGTPGLDLVIHLHRDHPTDDFIERSSADILGFVNLLTGVVPLMIRPPSERSPRNNLSRIVAIKSDSNSARAFADSSNQYNDLVQSIVSSQNLSNSSQKPVIEFSTIICDFINGTIHRAKSNQDGSTGSPSMGLALPTPSLTLPEQEIAERILKVIESGRTFTHVSGRRNLLEFCSLNLMQLANIGLDKLQIRKGGGGGSQKISLKVQ
ncbi:uncharacterized protein LOC129739096 [Uranotaenia lowii]|uniref:uncharacterized protein LOC129739096 n=1 Tax=Uranotaenia lowii TaxID=190385 RepID=UPI0024795BE8|nr:uncharacterized protein LOC129739096 [Uranotaenia lowii]XP_055586471.1 uncharacterized protein LOC129739096 [Uranotaenia lowii]XP_055586472.1 uncharacterized protein LOC129739096 [Uranotaenia lowii]